MTTSPSPAPPELAVAVVEAWFECPLDEIVKDHVGFFNDDPDETRADFLKAAERILTAISQNGSRMTFWLFTHPNGRWTKGEGSTDEEAIAAAIRAGKEKP